MDEVCYMNKAGRDVDNTKKLLQDSITLSNVVWEDDTYCLPRTNRIYIDKFNPRTELTISPVEFIGIFDNEYSMNIFINNCKTCSKFRKGTCGILKSSLENRITKEVILIDNKWFCNNYNETKRKATKYEFIEKTFDEIIKMNNKDKNTYLNKLTKDKLLELCKNNNIEIKKSWSKNKIIDKINLYKA